MLATEPNYLEVIGRREFSCEDEADSKVNTSSDKPLHVSKLLNALNFLDSCIGTPLQEKNQEATKPWKLLLQTVNSLNLQKAPRKK